MAALDKRGAELRAKQEARRRQQRWRSFPSAEARQAAMEAEAMPLREAVAKKAELERAARAQLAQQEQEQAALERSTQERAAKKAELGARKTALQTQLQAVRGALEGVVGERKRLWRENEDSAAAIESVTAAAAKERRELGRLVRTGGRLMSRCRGTCGAGWRR